MCSETLTHRKTGGRERVRKMTREERTPSWLDPGEGRDTHLPSKRNAHVQNLQLKPFTCHRLLVNGGGHSCTLRGSVSQSCHRLLSPCHQQYLCWGLQLPRTARKVENKETLFLSATRNPSMARTYSNAKWKDCVWNSASSFQQPSVTVPGSDALLLCQAYLHFIFHLGP